MKYVFRSQIQNVLVCRNIKKFEKHSATVSGTTITGKSGTFLDC